MRDIKIYVNIYAPNGLKTMKMCIRLSQIYKLTAI